MAQFDIKSLTSVGANDLARALNGERITWDYMQASTDYFSTNIANLTSLTNVIKNLTIISAKQVADGQFDVTSRISSSDVSEQTTIRTYGLFAHFNTEKPALMAIISDKTGDVLYPVSQATNPQDLQQTMSLVFPNPDGKPIPYVISNSGYAMDTEVLHIANDETATGTKTFQKIKISNTKFPSLVQTDGQSITLDGGTTELSPADDSKVVHTTGDETIDGKKKFDTDPTDGAGNAYAKTVDVNQQLDKKVNVADMRKPASDVAGIEEVNTKQDKIGYTPADDSKVIHNSGTEEIAGQKTYDIAPIDKTSGQPYITKDGVPKVDLSNYATNSQLATKADDSAVVHSKDMRKPASDVAGIEEVNAKQDKISYTPADDSKVVHTADMRKPASDVAGIEEVNAKQDKLTITPADDSKVVHTADTSNWQKSKVTDDTGMPLLMLGDTDDLSAKINGLPNGYFTIYCTGKTLNNPSASPKRGIIHITASEAAGSGILFSEDKNAYIITMLNGITYTKIANDSLVAHLSGANNFDTTPTVNNNPLLLASSLPSDLARLSQDANFTAKLQQNGQDVALANNTIARNPNTGSVSETNTFTAQQTFSIAPVINDASTSKGDNQAATMADLNNYYHANTNDDAALAAAKVATVPGIFWFEEV